MSTIRNRVEKLEQVAGPDDGRPAVVLITPEGQTADEALAVHLSSHPRDRGRHIITVEFIPAMAGADMRAPQ